MFKYMLQNKEDQQANVQAAARDQFTSPPPTTNHIDTHSGKQFLISSTVSTTVVSTTGNTVKTVSKYQLFSNTTRKQK